MIKINGSKAIFMCNEDTKKRKPNPRSFFTNLTVDMPWQKKILLVLRNNWIKIRNFQNCCGHPGEPGC